MAAHATSDSRVSNYLNYYLQHKTGDPMSSRSSNIKFLLTRVLPLCLLVGVNGAGEVAHAQTPVVSGVAIVSPTNGDTFDLGELIRVRVNFDRDVEVTGNPTLSLTLDSGSVSAWFWYRDASALWFTYLVRPADHDPDGISIAINSLALNDGTIKIDGGTTDANLSLGAHVISNSTNRKVDGGREKRLR